MGGLTLICFARASYVELDPATTQSAHEPILGANFESEWGPEILLNMSLIIRFGGHVTIKKGLILRFGE